MKAFHLVLPAIALALVACDDKPSGRGVTEPSPRYEGVEQQPKWEPERNPGTLPTQGSPSSTGSLDNSEAPTPSGQDQIGRRGQSTTPPSAFADAGR